MVPAIGQAVEQKPATQNMNPATMAAEPATSTRTVREVAYSFQELGAASPLQLRGIDGSDTVGFGLRRDELVVGARLRLRYAFSPALLPEISHMKIFLNDEVVAALPLPKDQAGTEQSRDIPLDTRYLSDFNQLRLQLIGHYTLECEDALHSSLWAHISNRSQLQLTVQRIALPDDLALLPIPFFDMRDHRRMEIPFVFNGQPSLEILHAAGLVASWFGSLADYREARFPSFIDRIPERSAVILAGTDHPPQGLPLPAVEGPTLAIMAHPADPASKLLLVLGRDAAEVMHAATALVQARVALSGPAVRVGKVIPPPRRAAYDAPRWLRSDRPVKLGELIEFPEDLQVKSRIPKRIDLRILMPPDLFIWNSDGIPLRVNYRYTPPVADDNSTLNIGINHEFIRSLLLKPELRNSEQGKVTLRIRDDSKPVEAAELEIPAFQVASENLLQFQYSFDYHKQGLCRSFQLDNVRASIDPDSTLDLSHFAHYTELPNLAYFTQSGFPFTKYADLAETAVVMPDQPDALDIETMLTLLGYMGRATGVPALRYRLIDGRSLESARDADLLIVDALGTREVMDRFGGRFPALLEQKQRILATEFRSWAPHRIFDLAAADAAPATGRANLQTDGPITTLVGFESPLQSDRSVVAISATTADAVRSFLDALSDGSKRMRIRGDTAFIRGDRIDSQQVGDRYFVGELPLWTRLSFHASRHPLLLAFAGILGGILAAFLIYRGVTRVARRRLAV